MHLQLSTCFCPACIVQVWCFLFLEEWKGNTYVVNAFLSQHWSFEIYLYRCVCICMFFIPLQLIIWIYKIPSYGLFTSHCIHFILWLYYLFIFLLLNIWAVSSFLLLQPCICTTELLPGAPRGVFPGSRCLYS